MSDIIYVENELNGMEVLINDIVQEVTPEGFIYVRDGENELKAYVSDILKPEIKVYVDEQKNSAATVIASEAASAKQAVIAEVNTVQKPALETFVNDKKAEIEALCEAKEDSLSDIAQDNVAAMENLITAATNAVGQAATSAGNAETALGLAEAAVQEANQVLEDTQEIAAQTKLDASHGNIGDIKYTVRTDVPNGGAWCDGTEYTKAAFPSVYQMLVDGDLQSTDYTTYNNLVSSNGACGFFGLDTANEKFKVPLLSDIYIKAGQIPSIFGAESLPDIEGTFGLANYGNYISGAFSQTKAGDTWQSGTQAPLVGEAILEFKASRSSAVYQDEAKVNPDHVVYRAYVVLYASAAEASEVQAAELITALGGKANTDLGNVTPAQSFVEAAVVWGMPDYTAGVSITGYRSSSNQFSAPCDGVLIFESYGGSNGMGVFYNDTRILVPSSTATTSQQIYLPIQKGDRFYTINDGFYAFTDDVWNSFFPFKGVN